MIKIGKNREPEWLELFDGAKLKLLPLTTALMSEARSTIASAGTASDAERSVLVVKAVARAAVVGWEGIADANGEAADVTDDAVDDLMDDYRVADIFQQRYLFPQLNKEDEKKG